MFVHQVLFQIKAKDVPLYVQDCKIWKREASKHPGYLGCHTLKRTNQKGQYAASYLWKSEVDCGRFMKKHHDRLVRLSRCPVKVLGYYDFKTV